MQQGEEHAPRPGWGGASAPAGGGQEEPQGGAGQGLADQLLAAQFHALHLGAGGAGNSAGAFHLPGRTPSPSVSSHGGSNGSPHQPLDPSLLGNDLLVRLQMGAAAASGGPPVMLGRLPNHHLAHAGSAAAGLPPGGPAAAAAAAAAVQHAPHLQQRQPPGRRRGGGSGGGASGGRRNEEKVRRTVYISDISDTVSEAQLAGFFQDCGQLVDCRVCGDPNSSMRFAFIEFLSEDAAQQALSKSGSLLGDFPIRVSPSKTAIVPVNNTYLPRSSEERELVARTVFVGNIDRVVEREQLREFFENLCGPVSKIRLLGDSQHNSKIAFVEFATAESARGALKLSGALLGTLPLRVSPSKTPVRIESRRNQDVRTAQPPLGAAPPGMPAGMVMAGTGGAPLGNHPQLPPALLMAVAGLHMYPGSYHG